MAWRITGRTSWSGQGYISHVCDGSHPRGAKYDMVLARVLTLEQLLGDVGEGSPVSHERRQVDGCEVWRHEHKK